MLNIVELDQNILMKLPIDALGQMSQVNRNLNMLFSDNYFWKEKCKQDFGPITYIKPQNVPYMQYYRKCWKSQYPQIEHAEKASEAGRIRELEWLFKQNIKATFKGANRAARNGDLETLKWLYGKCGVLPDIIGANWAGSRNHLHILKWLNKHNINMNIYGYRNAIKNDHTDILNWLRSQ